MQRECVYIEVLTTSQFALSVCSVSSFRIFHDCWNLRILIGLSGPDVSKVLSATVFTENEKETEANIKSNYILSKTEYPSQCSSNNTQWQIVYPPASIVSDGLFVNLVRWLVVHTMVQIDHIWMLTGVDLAEVYALRVLVLTCLNLMGSVCCWSVVQVRAPFLVFAPLVLEPDTDDPWGEPCHLHQLFLDQGVRAGVSAVASLKHVQLGLAQDRPDPSGSLRRWWGIMLKWQVPLR